jgi:diaminopimelate epimerase
MSSLNSYNRSGVSAREAYRGLILPFTKMHGLGNDFVVLSASELYRLGGTELIAQWEAHAPIWAKALCTEHFGIGADGLIVIFDLESKKEIPSFVQQYPGRGSVRYAWTYTNKDGSWSLMCGNGLRCAALWLEYQGLLEATNFSISTGVGNIAVDFVNSSNITIDLGKPLLKPKEIPMMAEQDQFIQQLIALSSGQDQRQLRASAVGMGNPHCVIFDELGGDNVGKLTAKQLESLQKIAESLQRDPIFPEGVNVNFACSEDPAHVRLIVFERGSGRTLACGSAAAATVVAGVLEKRLERRVTVELEGGELFVEWSKEDEHVRLTGPATIVFTGSLNVEATADRLPLPGLREVAR